MTTIRVYRKAGVVSGIEISGHSGYASEGEDIVCAAVTSAVRYAEVLLNDVLDADIKFRVDSESAFLSFFDLYPSPDDGETSARAAVLEGFARYMKQLSVEYPDYIKVMEVQQNA